MAPTARQGLIELLKSSDQKQPLSEDDILQYVKENHMGRSAIWRVLEGLIPAHEPEPEDLESLSVRDLCLLMLQYAPDGGVADAESDDSTTTNDQDSQDSNSPVDVDDPDLEVSDHMGKARALARAAIAQQRPDELERHVRHENDDGTNAVSANVLTVVQQTLATIERIQETYEQEKKEAEQREMRLKNQITEMSEKLTGLTTLMERQAIEMEKGRGAANELRSSFAEYRTEAGDREVRYTRQISNLKTQISTLEGKMDEMTAEAEKSEHRLSTALAKLKQQSQTPKLRAQRPQTLPHRGYTPHTPATQNAAT